MGSFRLAAGRLHLHKHFNFAESRVETVWPALLHSCGSELTLSLIHISEPTRRTPISYAVFCLKKKNACSDGTQHEMIADILFFFNDAATTEIYTSLFVGSVRCV